jgi:hypothetical protein
VSPHVPIHGARAAARRRQIASAFRGAGAVSARAARTLAELALAQDAVLRRMRDTDVVRRLPGDRYYLDEDRLRDQRAHAARIGLTVAFAVFVAIVLVLALNP